MEKQATDATAAHTFPAVLDPEVTPACDRCGSSDPEDPCIPGM
jgi:hypothetical protein